MNRTQAIELARAEVAEGFAIRYMSDSDGVHVESDQGWSTLWPADEPCAYLGSNDCNPDY